MQGLVSLLQPIQSFLHSGGEVLVLIALLTFVMWTLIFERLWYFHGPLKTDVNGLIAEWEQRSERTSWHAHQVRRLLISQGRMAINSHLPFIKTLVALCPLMGLLGTVWGMIEVFNIMAVTGGGEARAMAGGVSKATIPTMAGMVAALSGVFANTYLVKVAERESSLLEDHLTMDH